MYRDGTGVPPWKEHFGGFAPSQPTGGGAMAAGYSRVLVKFLFLQAGPVPARIQKQCATRN